MVSGPALLCPESSGKLLYWKGKDDKMFYTLPEEYVKMMKKFQGGREKLCKFTGVIFITIVVSLMGMEARQMH